MAWHFSETGTGRPLVLLHGIGMSHAAWRPVLPYLRLTRRVLAFDIAGFGATPRLPHGVRPTVANLVTHLERSLQEVGLEPPIDLAGNSLGGAMALEAAKRPLARRVVAISPAGLWHEHDSPHVKLVFGLLRLMALRSPHTARRVLKGRWLRELALAVPLSVGSRRMPQRDALRALEDLSSSAFEETFASTREPFSGAGVAAPATIAFGDRDWILPRRSQQRNGLPEHVVWIRPRGWGHVPMWADPAGVAALILGGTRG